MKPTLELRNPNQREVNNMGLRDDFKRPLNEIENVMLRRTALIITSFIMIPVIVIMGIIDGIFDAMIETKGVFIICWKGQKLKRGKT